MNGERCAVHTRGVDERVHRAVKDGRLRAMACGGA